MTKNTEIKENKQAYYEYRDSISNNYLEDYIKKTRGKGLRANISCIYADTHPAHKKGTDNKPSMGYDKTTKKYHCMTCDQWASLVDIAKYDNKLTNDTETITFLKNEYPAIELFKNDSTTINNVKTVQVIDSVEINTSYDFTNFINESNAKVIDSFIKNVEVLKNAEKIALVYFLMKDVHVEDFPELKNLSGEQLGKRYRELCIEKLRKNKKENENDKASI